MNRTVTFLLLTCTAFGLTAAAQDRVKKLDASKLEYKNDAWGYLSSLLLNLDINPDSQLLVFSKTSFQQELISPKSPRAVYFNDEVAIGFVNGGELIEITALQPGKDVGFYALSTKKEDKPAIVEQDICLFCHDRDIFVATVYPNSNGQPAYVDASRLFHKTDQRTPFEERWGGWYVTGNTGKMEHRGNAVAPDPFRPIDLETEGTKNVMSLEGRLDTSKYLQPSSDVVALLTLEHQTMLSTYIGGINRTKPGGDSLETMVDRLLAYMTFSNELALPNPVTGTSTFTKTFPQRGPRDPQGRSLRDFDLQKRLFKYPVSYMIYTEYFDGMFEPARDLLYRKLYDQLTAPTATADQKAALEILRATKPNLPAYWK